MAPAMKSGAASWRTPGHFGSCSWIEHSYVRRFESGHGLVGMEVRVVMDDKTSCRASVLDLTLARVSPVCHERKA